MAWVDEDINTYVRDLIKPKLNSVYAKAKPLFAWIAGSSKAGLDSLGDPDVGAFFGGRNLGIGQRSEIAGSKIHKFRYQKGQTDAATSVDAGGSTPVASGFAEDNVGTAGVVWHHLWNPVKVREDSVLNVMNGGFSDEMTRLKIADVIEEAMGMAFQMQLEKQQAQLWAGTLTSAQQDADSQSWADYIGVTHWCDDGVNTAAQNTVGGVNRTVHTQLKGNVLRASELASTVLTLRVLRQARLLQDGGGTTDWHYHRQPRRAQADACSLIITTPTLWEKIANDADAKNQINSNDIPQFARAGHMNPLIRMDDSLIAWDHDCPSGEVYWLTPDQWTFETQRGANFKVEEWQRKWLNEEGGGFYRWTQIHTKARLTCRRPDLQIKGVGFTAA